MFQLSQRAFDRKNETRNFFNLIWIVSRNSSFVFRVVEFSFALLCNFNNYSGIFLHIFLCLAHLVKNERCSASSLNILVFFGSKHNVLIMSSHVDTFGQRNLIIAKHPLRVWLLL